MSKIVIGPNEWDMVYQELENEVIKTSSYDNFLISLIGEVKNKSILDFGSGPGVIAKALQNLGAKIEIYDINEKILEMANKRIKSQNIIHNIDSIRKDYYDIILCNLVVCIVEHDEAINIFNNIYNALLPDTGVAFIGFCNPKVYNIQETMLDIRHSGNRNYSEEHCYLKEKKEGGYVIPEMHRSIEWYDKVLANTGFTVEEKYFTKKYTFNNNEINDFIIYKARK